MGWKVITPPTSEQITLEYARLQLGLDADEEDSPPSHPLDALILEKIPAAREACEEYLGMALAPQTVELALDSFIAGCNTTNGAIELPMPPIISITSVIYVDADGDEQTMDEADYVLDNYQEPGWLLPAYGTSWPSTYGVANAVKIRYLCGYSITGDSPDDKPLPRKFREAMVVRLDGLVNGRGDGKKQEDARIAMESMLQLSRVRMGV